MNDQQHENRSPAEDPSFLQMAETRSNPCPQPNRVEKRLKNNKARVRREPAFFAEPKTRNFVELGVNFCFTRFHLRWPPQPDYFVIRKQIIPSNDGPPQAFTSAHPIGSYATRGLSMADKKRLQIALRKSEHNDGC
jgi:hypothetical protein